MEIWFDFCFHHLWMLLLWILYTLEPLIYRDGTVTMEGILDEHYVSANVYLLSFIMQIPLLFVKISAVIGTKS